MNKKVVITSFVHWPFYPLIMNKDPLMTLYRKIIMTGGPQKMERVSKRASQANQGERVTIGIERAHSTSKYK